jgi:hypothetical protein
MESRCGGVVGNLVKKLLDANTPNMSARKMRMDVEI